MALRLIAAHSSFNNFQSTAHFFTGIIRGTAQIDKWQYKFLLTWHIFLTMSGNLCVFDDKLNNFCFVVKYLGFKFTKIEEIHNK
jgi:hypothetical protein